ncbi:hypothetical protein E4U53_005599 [Claviceps sorghi]|nr:hypothetical protein E4U53_005599 [Claviceps sorghi]
MKTLSRILSRRRSGEGDCDPEVRRRKGGTPGRQSGPAAVPESLQLPSRRVSGSDAVLAKRRRQLSRGIVGDGCVVVDASPEADPGRGSDAASSKSWRNPPIKICPKCAAVDFPCLLDWKLGQPRPWVQLSHVLRPLPSQPPFPPVDDSHDHPGVCCPRPGAPQCPFCLFFRAMIGPLPTDDLSKFSPYLRIRQAFERLDGIGEKHELARSVLMEVTTQKKSLPWGYLLRAEDKVDDGDVSGYLVEKGQAAGIRARRVPPLLNPSVPQCWLDFCRRNHCNSACTAAPMQQHPIAALQLIDCHEKRVVAAEGIASAGSADATEYLALSYAWSQTGLDSSAEAPFDVPALRVAPGGQLPDALPSLFADAIAFTTRMGFRYLWIDRFCLQVDAAARRRQIDVMGEIYSGASLTLIIAADDDAPPGIAGLSTPREHQLSLRLNKALYTTSLVRPDLEVASSKWASRAWTLQEGLLSRRRLIFTSSQVYFQCRALHCYESLSLPLRLAPDWKLGRVFPAGGDGPSTQPGRVKHLIEAFMCRDLTNHDERLDAIKALLPEYGRADAPAVQYFLGLPLFHPDDFVMTGVVSQADRLAASLGWIVCDGTSTTANTASAAQATATTATTLEAPAEPCCSRTTTSFPSWTWLAWRLRRKKTVPTPDNLSFSFNLVGETSPVLQGVSAAPGMEISVGFTNDHTVLSWEMDGDAISTKPTETISFLRLETYCFELTAFVDAAHPPAAAAAAIWSLQEQQAAALGAQDRRVVQDMVQAVLPRAKVSPPASAADHPLDETAAPAKHEMPLLGVLVSGRNWKGGGSPCQVTVLICGRSTWEDGPWVRLGALALECESFGAESSGEGVMRGVKTGDEERRPTDLPVRRRELDLY